MDKSLCKNYSKELFNYCIPNILNHLRKKYNFHYNIDKQIHLRRFVQGKIKNIDLLKYKNQLNILNKNHLSHLNKIYNLCHCISNKILNNLNLEKNYKKILLHTNKKEEFYLNLNILYNFLCILNNFCNNLHKLIKFKRKFKKNF